MHLDPDLIPIPMLALVRMFLSRSETVQDARARVFCILVIISISISISVISYSYKNSIVIVSLILVLILLLLLLLWSSKGRLLRASPCGSSAASPGDFGELYFRGDAGLLLRHFCCFAIIGIYCESYGFLFMVT